jgi:hypothetical protein
MDRARLAMKRAMLVVAVAATLPWAAEARAITRDEVVTRARAFAYHPWTCAAANLKASCNASYTSLFVPGAHVGVAYDWGGYMSLWDYDSQIAAGYGAGSQESDGILACTAGLDCSGFVSQAWSTGHFTTSTLHQTSSQIQQSALLAGDVFNMAGFHVAMYTSTLSSGEPAMIEAVGYNVHVNTFGGWSHVNGYVPRRFGAITGTTASVPLGTPTTPIPITSFPFTDQRDTRQSTSRLFGRCAAAPTIDQGGPEYVYSVVVSQPGTLTVSVADDAAADIDVQLLDLPSPRGCFARHDSTLTRVVGCGTYYVVADTFGSSAGAYTLSATFTPSGQPCGSVPGPSPFQPLGKLGDACNFPGNPSLPYCNANVRGETCVYTQSTSFCSMSCATDADCNEMPGGGCCRDLGKGELYCLKTPLCGGDAGVTRGGEAGTPGRDASAAPSSPEETGGEQPPDPAAPGGGNGASEQALEVQTISSCALTRGPGALGGPIAFGGFGLWVWVRRRARRTRSEPTAPAKPNADLRVL